MVITTHNISISMIKPKFIVPSTNVAQKKDKKNCTQKVEAGFEPMRVISGLEPTVHCNIEISFMARKGRFLMTFVKFD